MNTTKIIKGVVNSGRYSVTAPIIKEDYANSNSNRVMMVVTLERADGRQIMRESIGAFPDMTPEPTPEPEEVSEE